MDLKSVLPDFQEFLTSKKLAPAKNVPYLANWVSQFLAFSNSRPQADANVLIAEFLNSLEANQNIDDWQIRQASEAIALYLNHFKGEVANAFQCERKLKANLSDSKALLAEMERLLRLKHFAYNTEVSYLDWVKRFFSYVLDTTNGDGRIDLTPASAQNYLSHLAINKQVASSTQNQALCALLFLFRDVLGQELGDISGMVWAKRGKKLPVVLWVEEVRSLFRHLSGTTHLMAQLLYGAGLRITELCRLRVFDVDFEGGLITVRNGKGDKDRSTIFPEAAKEPLSLHLPGVKALHERDIAAGHGEVYLPSALERKYPNAAREWKWQYVFPSANLSVDPRSGKVRRHHMSDKALQVAVSEAVKKAGITKHATVHTLRHSFATHLLMSGVNIREVQSLLGHKNVETTMIYTHVMRDMANAPKSPLDVLYENSQS